MSIYKAIDIKGSTLIEKITNILNIGRNFINLERKLPIKKEDEDIDTTKLLSPNQVKFVESVKDGMTKEEVQDLEKRIVEDPTIIQSYQNRSMLKDASNGQLRPSSAFAIDINFPARGFRAIKSKHS